MSTIVFSNFANTTLASGINNAATSITLALGTGSQFPSPTGGQYFVIVFTDAATKTLHEVCNCTARTGDTLSIVRAQESTTALSWNAGDFVACVPTAGQMAACAQSDSAVFTNTPTAPTATYGTNNNQIANAAFVQAAITPVSSVIGSASNMAMLNSTAGTSVTFSADEVVVGAALGGVTIKLGSFNQTLNVSTTGIGGMDTGAAPASGFIAVYAAYNGTTQGIFAYDCTSAAPPVLYANGYPPSGYTDTCLIAILPTNGSRQIIPCAQSNRRVQFARIAFLSSAGAAPSYTPTSIGVVGGNAIVPPGAKTFSGKLDAEASGAATNLFLNIAGNSSGFGEQGVLGTNSGITGSFSDVEIITSQTAYYQGNASGATPQLSAYVTGYIF